MKIILFFVAYMEGVLDLYERKVDPDYPAVNLNEQSVQLISETETWAARRNLGAQSVDWQFTTSDARIKLKRL